MITSEQVKTLRDQTGISVMQCKAALEEAAGDMEKALMLLRKKGQSIAGKKGDRELGSGVVQSYIHSTKKVGAMVELLCETDFVSKNEEFVSLAREIALHAAATRPQYVRRSEIPQEEMAKIEEMYAGDVAGKPENLKATILSGKIDSYLKGLVLEEQSYVKDDTQTIKQLVDSGVQKFGERMEIGKVVCIVTK